MNPTLKNGEIVLINKFKIQLNNNDIIVIKKNNKIIVKRIIGIPHDTVEINEFVFVNERKFDDIYTENAGVINKIKLGEKEYFVLGDNRNNSIDSRYNEIGIIYEDEIIGKVMFK